MDCDVSLIEPTVSGNWRKVTLGDCVVVNDASYSPKEAWPFINYLDTGNITENRISEVQHLVLCKDKIPSRARRKIKPGDIVYSTVRPNQRHFGLMKEPPDNFLVSTGFATIRGIEGLALTEYVYWFLAQDHIIDHLHSIAEQSTSAYPSIKPTDIDRLELELPPLSEQRRVAHILGTLDEKIELNRRMNATLEGMARALFKSWFVDFEPVRAKMEGHWRRGESLPGMPAELYDLFPGKLVPSELEEVPEGWEVRPLGDVIEIHDSKRVPLNSRQRACRQGKYPYYGAAGVMDYVDSFLFDGVYVLAGEDGSVVDADGHPVIQYVWGKFWVNNHAHVVKGRNGVKEEQLYLFLQQVNIMAFVTGAVQLKINQRNLRSIPFILPDDPVCQAFTRLVDPLFHRVRDNTDEAESLVALRDGLLPKLVSGEFQDYAKRTRVK